MQYNDKATTKYEQIAEQIATPSHISLVPHKIQSITSKFYYLCQIC